MKVLAKSILNAPINLELFIDDSTRVLVIGDLDGNYLQFERALTRVNYEPSKDLLICLGDVIDRGKDSVSLLNYIQQNKVRMVLGNHEHIMIESILSADERCKMLWEQNGGSWHLEEVPATLEDLCRWLLKQPLSITLNYKGRVIGLSHTLPPEWNWQVMPVQSEAVRKLLWDRERVKKRKHIRNDGVDFSIHGHNSTQVPFWIGNSYHIDTMYYGRPTIVELSKVIEKFNSLNA